MDSIPIGSKLSTMLSHLTVDEITAPEGYKVIIQIIEDAHAYLKDQSLEHAFDEAIFRGRRERGQSLTSFLAGKTAALAELRKQGLDLLATSAGRHLLGHLILRQGAFTTDQKQRIKVVTNGSIDYKQLETAIQKIFGDKLDDTAAGDEMFQRRWKSATYWDDGGLGWGPDDPDPYDDPEMDDDESDIFQDLIALNESEEMVMTFATDVPMVMEESEMMVMVNDGLTDIYYETRERLKGKGKGKGKTKKGKGKNNSRTFWWWKRRIPRTSTCSSSFEEWSWL